MLAMQPGVSTSSQALQAISPGAHHTGQHIGLNIMSETIYHTEAHGCVTKNARIGPELPNCRPKMSVSDSQSATVSEHALAAAPHWAACTASALPASGSAQMDVL